MPKEQLGDKCSVSGGVVLVNFFKKCTCQIFFFFEKVNIVKKIIRNVCIGA